MLDTHSNDELFSLYKNELVLRVRNKTNYKSYCIYLDKYCRFLHEKNPSVSAAKAFIAQWNNHKVTTLQKVTSIIKAFMEWYGLPLNLSISVPRSLPMYVRDSDVQLLLKAAAKKRSGHQVIPRDILIIKLGYYAGLRRSEIANLKVEDIMIQEQQLIVRKGKGNKDRTVPLPKLIMPEIVKYVEGKTPEEVLFEIKPETITTIINQIAIRAGIKLTTHSLRHGYATRLLERGANIRLIQELMGHSMLSTTEVYISILPRHLREAVDLLDNTPSEISIDTINTEPPYTHVADIQPTSTNYSGGVPDETRLRHWNALICVIEKLHSTLEMYTDDNCFSKNIDDFKSIVASNASDFTFKIENDFLFPCLLVHLDNEFGEFTKLFEEYKRNVLKYIQAESFDLIKQDQKRNLLMHMLRIVYERGTVIGRCQICEGWYST